MAVDLRPVLAPRSVAVVGASERSFIARIAIENCRTLGFEGRIFPIHPRHDQVMGLQCYPTLSALPDVPDCALIALNADRAVDSVEDACARGVRALILPASGFAEQGPDGAERQRRIVAAAAASGTLIVGPNCMGVVSPPDHAAVYIGSIARPLAASNVSVVAQSGSVVELLVNSFELGFARVFSAGNEAALTVCDYVEYLLGDAHTDVIMLFLEAYRDPARLLALAEHALALGKPLVTIALGRSDQSQAMAQAHSGALATSYRRLSAALRRRGAILCDDLDEWIATALIAARGHIPRGNRIGAVTVSGGEAGLLLDLAASCGVEFPPLPDHTQRELTERLTAQGGWTNPADGWDKGPYEDVYPALLAAMAGAPDVDVLAAAVDVPADQGEEEARFTAFIGRCMADLAARTGKPAVYLSLATGRLDQRIAAALESTATPLLGGARAGLRAISLLAEFSKLRSESSAGEASPPTIDAARLKDLIAALPATADEEQSRQVLAMAGIPLVDAAVAANVDAAVAAAARIPGAVALKAVLPGVAHKSDVGAVALRLSGEPEVRAAADRLLELCSRHGTPPRLLVSPHLEPIVEVICGVICDPDWGAFVMLGLGGVLAEALDDVALASVPLRPGQAESLVVDGRTGRVIGSKRRPADIPALIGLVRRLGVLADELWRIDPTCAVDLNPVMVMPPGGGAWATDALVTRGT